MVMITIHGVVVTMMAPTKALTAPRRSEKIRPVRMNRNANHSDADGGLHAAESREHRREVETGAVERVVVQDRPPMKATTMSSTGTRSAKLDQSHHVVALPATIVAVATPNRNGMRGEQLPE
jgi:phage terminase large subunit-like protein